MNRGDIYLVDLEPTKGTEQRGSRPVVIVSPTRFNLAMKAAVVVPITNGGNFPSRLGYAVEITGSATTGRVLCNQIRTLDVMARGGRKLGTLPADCLTEVLLRVSSLFEEDHAPV